MWIEYMLLLNVEKEIGCKYCNVFIWEDYECCFNWLIWYCVNNVVVWMYDCVGGDVKVIVKVWLWMCGIGNILVFLNNVFKCLCNYFGFIYEEVWFYRKVKCNLDV